MAELVPDTLRPPATADTAVAVTRRPLWQRLFWGRNPRATVKRAFGLAVVSFLLFRYVLLPVQISGISMQPTYRDRSCHLVNRLAYSRNPPQRGDPVVIKTTGMKILFLKRVIGLPGEKVSIENGVIFINGEALPEPYVKARLPWDAPDYQLGPEEYYVLGDNRATEEWTHRGGPVRRSKIVGKVIW